MKSARIFTFIILLCLIGGLHTTYGQDVKVLDKKQERIQRNQKPANEQLAVQYYRNGEFDKSAELFVGIYAEKQSHYNYTYLFNSFLGLKDYKSAEKLVKKHSKKNNSYRYKIDLAYVYGLDGLKKKSANILNKLIKDLPENKSQIVQLASALQSRGYYAAALNVYKDANINNDNYSFDLEMANAYQLTGDFENMFESYLNHLGRVPKDNQMIKNRIQSLLRYDVNDNFKLILKQKLLLKTREYPENIDFTEMLLWYSMQTEDFEMAYRQAASIDKRFGNAEGYLLELGEIALSNEEYDVAIMTYEYMMDNHKNGPFYNESYSGYYSAIVVKELENNTEDIKSWKNLQKTGDKAIDEIGVNAESATIARLLGYIVAFKLFEYEEAKQILERTLGIPNINIAEKNQIKLDLADILVLQDYVWEASLLYSQIEGEMKHETIGHEAKYRNAKLFFYAGEFEWAITRLDILKSATSKLIANDAMELSMFIRAILEEDTMGFTLRKFAAADLYLYRQQYDSAILFLDKIAESYGQVSREYMTYQKASVYETQANYIMADSIYQEMWTNYPESVKSDNAIFKQAELNRLKLENEEKAMELYLKLMKEHPDSVYSGEARLRYRELREDDILPITP